MSTYAKPLPKAGELDAPYWEGARRKELRLQKCNHCGNLSSAACRICTNCASADLEWVKASGRGTIWSFGIFHKAYFPSFAEDLPYNVVIVELDEGPRMFSNLVGVETDQIRIGVPVQAVFDVVTDDVALVKFELARS